MRTQIAAVIGIVVGVLATEAGAATKFMDFDKDGYADLAIGAPYATVGGQVAAGTVTVIYGTANGLNSSTRSQLWTETPAGGVPRAGDLFGYALEAADFNDDGYMDLAIGAPGEGRVFVLHGWGGGLKGKRGTFCTVPCHPQPRVFTMPEWQPGDQFGFALASGHFTNDAFADLAVGAPGHTYPLYGGPTELGAVRVLYSYDASGLSEYGSEIFTLNTDGMSGAPAMRDHFGASLAAGNFGKSAQDDLAIGIPDKKETTAPYGYGAGGGAVSVVFGGSQGLSARAYSGGGGNQYLIQSFTPWPAWEPGDKFGYALAAGHFAFGAYDDLAIGIPGKTVSGRTSAGAVTVLYGTASGLTTTNSQQWTSANLFGFVRTGANFGRSLAAGNLGNGGGDDLAIGTPFYAVNGVTGTGLVALVFSDGFALDAASSNYLYQPSSPANAHFGFSLSAVELGGNAFAALAIGVPGWPNAGILHGGGVAIRYGSFAGPSATANSVFWTQDVLPGVSEENAIFGFALSR